MPGTPHVDVRTDPATNRVTITLDLAAADRLLNYLDDIGPGLDLVMNAGKYGLEYTTAEAVSDVVSRIASPLRRLPG